MEATGICSYELVSADGSDLPAFSAGAHIDVRLPDGLTRQYSLCNDPAEVHRYVIGVLNEPNSRGGSRAMHEAVEEGDTLTIGAPRNNFALEPDADHSILLAGGIGITPILCMAQRLTTLGSSFELHYAARSRARMAFHDRIVESPFRRQTTFHLDDGPAAQKMDLAQLLAGPASGRHLYVCGPKGFMDAVLAAARLGGWAESRLHFEFFAGESSGLPSDRAFEVQLASSGRVIEVAADHTVLKALALAGVEIPASCEQGVCGTCLTRVLHGQPDHRDFYLTKQEHVSNQLFLPCCSRSKSARLVLDL